MDLKSPGTERSQRLRTFYPAIEPFRFGRLEVSHGHSLYYEEVGDPEARAVIVLHGGPGGGCSTTLRRFFNPRHWHAVLFDQRGCGRSRPLSRLEGNTTWDLIADMERLREHLGLERWTVFGGSWGATLALAYALTHPDRCDGIVLRGVFLCTQEEINWFYRPGGASRFLPEAWQRFLAGLPASEQADPLEAYYQHLMQADVAARAPYARAWSHWEAEALHLADRPVPPPSDPGEAAFVDTLARLEAHYFWNCGFLESDGWLLKNAASLEGIPGFIVQGRYDMVTPPAAAYALHKAWPGSELRMIEDAGHAATEPGTVDALVSIMDTLALHAV